MRIIQRYLAGTILKTTLLALFVLVSLFLFFTLIDQLADTVHGSYGVRKALVYTFLTIPRISYELFPIAAVIGSMATLGITARNSELDVILTSGVSRFNLSKILIKSSFLLVLSAILIGELIVPPAEEMAQKIRSVALAENGAVKTDYGLWIRDGNNYVNIWRVFPGNRIEDIYSYEFDDANNLRSSFHASSAVYQDGKWLMQDLKESLLNRGVVKSRTIPYTTWDSLIDPEILNIVMVKPDRLSILGLVNYIKYLRQNSQNTQSYEQALWAKFIKPFSVIAMIVLAVPLVSGPFNFVTLGHSIFTGVLAGIIFHMSTQVSANLGIVYQVHPMISVMTPTVLLILLIFYLIRK